VKNYAKEINDYQLFKIVIIEKNMQFTKCISNFLSYNKTFILTNTFNEFKEAIQSGILKEVQILLLDIELPKINGVEAIPQLIQLFPHLRIIVLSSSNEEEMLFKALRNGAKGYLLKQDCLTHLENAINQVILGGIVFSPFMAEQILDFFNPKINTEYNLTKREIDVLQFLRLGMIKKDIAEKLNISFNTVDSHVKNIYKKMNVNSNIKATLMANKLNRKD